jgi:hypothetical protein
MEESKEHRAKSIEHGAWSRGEIADCRFQIADLKKQAERTRD